MSTSGATSGEAFRTVKVRVTGLVFCGDDLALLRRSRAGSPHYSTVGGNVDAGEDFRDAAARELREELGLMPERSDGLELIGMADARVTRPGPTASPRKIHLIYRTHVTPEVRATLTAQEFDELPDGSHDVGEVVWIDYREIGGLPLFPPIGGVIAGLASPRAPLPAFELEPVTDRNYTWV
ncbi:NUDIX hydrolase [Kitasatospora sp. NPDC004240]